MEDTIEAIPNTMEKFFGCSGRMVKPSTKTVKSIIKKVPKGKLLTLSQLRERLSKQFSVETACPACTTKALQILSKEDKPVCYWRVIKKKGELINKYPGGVKGHAELLECEGFKINFSRKNPTVVDFETRLSIP